jgi:hypothetical protein
MDFCHKNVLTILCFALKKGEDGICPEDGRGKHNHPKVPEKDKELIWEHINMFPAFESHNSSSNTEKKYLSNQLSQKSHNPKFNVMFIILLYKIGKVYSLSTLKFQRCFSRHITSVGVRYQQGNQGNNRCNNGIKGINVIQDHCCNVTRGHSCNNVSQQ